MGGTKWTLIIRIIAAIYIVYLAITLIQEIQKGAVTGGMLVLGVVGIIAFFVFAVWAFASSVKGLIAESRKPKEENGEPAEDNESLTEEEEKARLRAIAESTPEDDRHSLFARMQKFSEETSEVTEEETVEEAAEEPAAESAEESAPEEKKAEN